VKPDIIGNRLNAFCDAYGIAEEYHGSLALLAEMAFVLGLELEVSISPREKEQSKCLDQ
jgi:hypothetical protein